MVGSDCGLLLVQLLLNKIYSLMFNRPTAPDMRVALFSCTPEWNALPKSFSGATELFYLTIIPELFYWLFCCFIAGSTECSKEKKTATFHVQMGCLWIRPIDGSITVICCLKFKKYFCSGDRLFIQQ